MLMRPSKNKKAVVDLVTYRQDMESKNFQEMFEFTELIPFLYEFP